MTKPPGLVLRRSDFVVEPVPLGMARDLVHVYHYSRQAARSAVYRHGLFPVTNPLDCRGVALWIPATPGSGRLLAGDAWQGVLVLHRLVIEPGAPTNAASYLLGRSIAAIRRDGARWSHLVTYADEAEGHTGGIYRATNWRYDGAHDSGHAAWVDAAGRRVSRKTGARMRTRAELEAAGATRLGTSRKHRFVIDLTGGA